MAGKKFGLPFGQEQIMEILPHRPPFLFVDRIVELEPGQRAVGIYTVRKENCQGHFPGNPIMPGVLLIEAMNQVGAVAFLSLSSFSGKIPVFRGVEKAVFRRPAKPGDRLTIEVIKTRQMGPAGKGEGKITLDNIEEVVSAIISFVVLDSV